MKYVAYYRVSTPKQGVSGLGLEAQRTAVRMYLEHAKNIKIKLAEGDVSVPGPLNHKSQSPLLEFTEVESGKRIHNRPQLAAAIQACRVYGAVLVIARLDRLSRNAQFLLGLKESGIYFVACDNPDTNRFTVGIRAVMAEEESRLISVRTREALAAARARGVKLGGDRGTVPSELARERAVLAKAARANTRAKDLAGIITEIRANGAVTLREIASGLNARGVPTARGGGQWGASQVQRILERL